MIIEYYRDQDLVKLRNDVITIYKNFMNEFPDLASIYYEADWHPELPERYNDTWRLITMMERFGYHSYYYDTVLYTSEFQEYDSQEKITGDGLTFNQAVCNMFVKYGLEYERRIASRKAIK